MFEGGKVEYRRHHPKQRLLTNLQHTEEITKQKIYAINKTKRHKFLQTKAQIQSKIFTAFPGWLVYATHEGINYRDERL
jgi:hypothetical protein